jgi:phage tail tape-measure protein
VNQEQLLHLTDDQRKRYKVLEALYSSAGWKLIEAFATAERAAQEQRMISAPSWEAHRYAKGAADAYSVFINMAEQFETEFSAMADEASNTVQFHDETKFE